MSTLSSGCVLTGPILDFLLLPHTNCCFDRCHLIWLAGPSLLFFSVRSLWISPTCHNSQPNAGNRLADHGDSQKLKLANSSKNSSPCSRSPRLPVAFHLIGWFKWFMSLEMDIQINSWLRDLMTLGDWLHADIYLLEQFCGHPWSVI